MVHPTHSPVLDSTLQLKDAGLVAATAVATVSAAATSYDVGAAAYQKGRVIVDVSAIETASNTEIYTIQVEGSNASDFGSGVFVLGAIRLGALEITLASADSATGRYVIHFDNVTTVAAGEEAPLRYLRLKCVVGGDAATGINYTAWLVCE